ncbi:putative mitochondrial hypothetical protein [Leptomonas pyrrhocoris]|uniref:Uncharacterized protein n=1 Tax=Leptomonas pyrrhocoris TaxID=157538 RepID=A0A0M9FPW5_LEPPY|nr:putative mitochondrial hypothetical protein [Leptomonas pyrrhocoris]KPA73650.1 putative mitochondrial hypothetical protein [Leptomonas pyrrhocoris]|eukprot:XP_015652089.1 putative mitochondrial hypothetical protein [Leptomonas pyrrhocoris]
MRGKGHQRAAEKAFQRWRQLHVDDLFNGRLLPTPLHATLRLPIFIAASSASSASPSTCDTPPPAAIVLHLSTNHRAVADWWGTEYDDAFLHVGPRTREGLDRVEADDAGGSSDGTPSIIASARVSAHVGPPAAPLGYPAYLAAEAKQWTEGVLRGETYAYDYAYADGPGGFALAPPPPPAPYLPPVRWLRQPLLDGFVAQRLTAHTGVTTGALIDARRSGAALCRQLPPFNLSPFYASSELLDRWCVFGEASALLPTSAAGPVPVSALSGPSTAAGHHRRAAELALSAAILPNYNAAWLNGAVVSSPRTGKCVVIVGPRSSGKTTLALHCVAPATAESHPRSHHHRYPTSNTVSNNTSHGGDDVQLRLTAAEHFLIGAGTPVQRMLRPHMPPNSDLPPHVFLCALPHRVKVGIGAVLGTLHPNPSLAAATTLPAFLRTDAGLRTFLANTDRVLWEMSMHYHVSLRDVCSSSSSSSNEASSPWQPAGVSALAGVVMLDWSVDELARAAPTPAHTRVRRVPLHAGGLPELLTRGRDYLFRGHYLVRSVYDEAVDGPARLADLFAQEWAARPPATGDAAPSLHCVEGSVNFSAATQLVRRLLAA